MQAVRLCLVRHQSRQHGGQADRLAAQLAPNRRSVPGIEDQVDRRQDGSEPVRQEVLGRHSQRDAGVADLSLCPDEPLRERRLRHEKGAGDLGRRETADEAQRQRDLCLRRKCRVAAGEDQLEPFVGNRQPPRLPGAPPRGRAAPSCVRASARGGSGRSPRLRAVATIHAPGLRRNPVARPTLGRLHEGVLHRVLGEVEVTEDAAEDRDRAGALVAIGANELVYATVS